MLTENILEFKEGGLPDYQKFNNEDFIERMMYFNPVYILRNKENLIKGEYIITVDNFIKMNLIFMRIQNNLPVVIQGDTGCGKTALLNFFATKILN